MPNNVCYSGLPSKFPLYLLAIRPIELNKSNGIQNIAESFFAVRLLALGVYVSFHGQIFDANNVKKNHSKQTFDMYHEYLCFKACEVGVVANLFYNEAIIRLA